MEVLNEEEYFPLASTVQISCGSKAFSRSSTNSLTGIQRRKRQAEDCNYISQYSLSPSCNNWLSGESPLITDYLNMHERRGTGSVIPVIASDSAIQGHFVKRYRRESKEDDDVIFVKAYRAPSPGCATRSIQCDVLVAERQGFKYKTCHKRKTKRVCQNKRSTSNTSHHTTVQRCQNTNSKATAAAVTNNTIDFSETLDLRSDYKSSDLPIRFVNGKEKYRRKEFLGAGGGGSVYSGIRISDKLQVAMKIISKNKINRWGEIDGQIVPIEFELLRMTSQSTNKGIIKMLDWFKRQNNYVLIMEHPKPALDLLQYINEHGAFSESLAKHIFKQLVKAVCHCHDKGVIHRDIKHENVIFNLQTREAKIIDFGCGAKVKDTPFTRLAGTLDFYPPEWFIEQKYDGQVVDRWCLGVLLYIMLEADVPFTKPEDLASCSLKFKRPMTYACRHLIASMLRKEKHKRLTLEEVLQHPWLSEDCSRVYTVPSSCYIENTP